MAWAREDDEYAGMYKRYMNNPTVAQWLLSPNSTTDFKVVRRENSVMLQIQSVNPAKMIPANAPAAAFPESHDLMFLDHVDRNFALGHIWGNFHSDTHPYAHLASRVALSGWRHVKTRKFASDLAVNDVLETVEFTWFTDNSAIVILNRIPCTPNKKAIRISQVLFFPPMQRTDVPPQQPQLVLSVDDRARCTKCDHEICTCPNPALPDGDDSSKTEAEPRVRSWQERVRLVSRGQKRGLLCIVYSDSFTANYQRITVRQNYESICDNIDAIGYRIQQHLTKLLSRLPLKSTPQTVSTLATIASDDCPTLSQELHVQSPISFRQKNVWFESSKPNTDKAEPKKQPCCTSANATPKSRRCRTHSQCTCINHRDTDNTDSSSKPCTIVTSPSAVGLLSPTSEPAPTADIPPLKTDATGKSSKPSQCPPQKMQNKDLAMILCSSSPCMPNTIDDITFFDPLHTNPANPSRMLLRPTPNPAREPVLPGLQDDAAARADPLAQFNGSAFDAQNPDSARCGPASTLPSAHARRPMPQGEAVLKRPRTDTLSKPDAYSFNLDAGWSPTLDGREKTIPLSSWAVNGHIERPLSALGRTFDVPTSSSLALMPNLQKPPTPNLASGLPQARPSGTEFEFQSAFEPLSTAAHADSAAKHGKQMYPVHPMMAAQRAMMSGKPDSDTTNATTTESAANGNACCEICGFSFAKRSNKLRHIQTVHNRVKQFTCDFCGAKFGLKADLGRHRFRIHESRAFRCPTCGKSFAEQGQLDQHTRIAHGEDSRPWECKTCHMRFGRKSSLTRHQQNVHQRTRYSCRICKKSYSQKFDAVRHERRVHGFTGNGGSAGIKAVGGII